MSQKVLVTRQKGMEHVKIHQLVELIQRHGAVDCVILDSDTIRARMTSDAVKNCRQIAEVVESSD